MILLKLFASLLLVSFGGPAWIGCLAPIAAVGGYALFWDSLRGSPRSKQFLIALLWFAFTQSIQLSWMTATEFQGYYILSVYTVVLVCLGIQFGLITFLVLRESALTIPKMLFLAAIWTLLEWSRFHVLCGFSWNPLGLSLTSYPVGMQLAAVFGVLGLTFWVFFTNLVGFKFTIERCQRKWGVVWIGLAFFPYLFGIATFLWHEKTSHKWGTLSALLVQPGLLPSQKTPLEGRFEDFISPWEQWGKIFRSLKPYRWKGAQIIALPESAVPFCASHLVYDYGVARDLIIREFGPEALKAFPELVLPFAKNHKVSNAFFGQFLANYFLADVIIGMDDEDHDKNWYSAATHFSPWADRTVRYEKRVLVPLAEYLPFAWCLELTKNYGIDTFYTHGKEAKVLLGPVPFSISICYEETFPNLVREGRLKGAQLFVNLTNDNWYPESKLMEQHFRHGLIRAVENGVPLLRSCNSGVTAAVDAFGRTIGAFEGKEGVLFVDVPTYHFATIYTFLGDALIVGLCLGFVLFYIAFRKFYKKINIF